MEKLGIIDQIALSDKADLVLVKLDSVNYEIGVANDPDAGPNDCLFTDDQIKGLITKHKLKQTATGAYIKETE